MIQVHAAEHCALVVVLTLHHVKLILLHLQLLRRNRGLGIDKAKRISIVLVTSNVHTVKHVVVAHLLLLLLLLVHKAEGISLRLRWLLGRC